MLIHYYGPYWLVTSGGTGTGKTGFRNGFKASQTRFFFIFLTNFFDIFEDFSKWSAPKVRPNFEKLSNMTKIWQKIEETPCLTRLNFIFRLILCTRKLDFGYVLVPPLIGTTFEYEYTVHYFTTDWKKICPNALWTFLVPKAAIYVID